jgi:hypothetical protein
VTFFRSLGGAFGVALSGSLLTSRVDASLAAAGSVADAARRAVAGGAGGIAAMPPGISSFRCGRGAQQLRKKPISMSSIVRPSLMVLAQTAG